MKLKQLALWAEIVSGIAVVLSLLFVGFEIRESSAINAARSVQALNLSINTKLVEFARNGELAELAIRGGTQWDSLTELEKARMYNWYISLINDYETAWKLHDAGMMSENDYRGWVTIACGLLKLDGPRRVWLQEDGWSKDFKKQFSIECERGQAGG